jgi:hypothetical protein
MIFGQLVMIEIMARRLVLMAHINDADGGVR